MSLNVSHVEDVLFVDASGWLAFSDANHKNHHQAVEELLQFSGSVITTDHELREFSRLAKSRIDDITIASLVWNLISGSLGTVVKPTDEEQSAAWEVFCSHESRAPTFANCISSIVVEKRQFKNWLSFDAWFYRVLTEVRSFAGGNA